MSDGSNGREICPQCIFTEKRLGPSPGGISRRFDPESTKLYLRRWDDPPPPDLNSQIQQISSSAAAEEWRVGPWLWPRPLRAVVGRHGNRCSQVPDRVQREPDRHQGAGSSDRPGHPRTGPRKGPGGTPKHLLLLQFKTTASWRWNFRIKAHFMLFPVIFGLVCNLSFLKSYYNGGLFYDHCYILTLFMYFLQWL